MEFYKRYNSLAICNLIFQELSTLVFTNDRLYGGYFYGVEISQIVKKLGVNHVFYVHIF